LTDSENEGIHRFNLIEIMKVLLNHIENLVKPFLRIESSFNDSGAISLEKRQFEIANACSVYLYMVS
jgi:hypothetical protein